MNVDVLTQVVIRRPIEVVAAYASDPSNVPSWYANITAVEWKTPPPVQVGSRVGFIARFLGRTLRYTYEFVEFEPGRRLVMRTQEGPFPMETTYTWEPASEGATTMTLRNKGRPSGFSAVAVPFMRPAIRRANRADLARLKSVLESASP